METKNDENNGKKTERKPGFDRRSEHYSYVKTKRDKLHAQFDPDKVDPSESTKIFKGISCYFTGCSEYDELRELLVQNGGRFDHFLSKSKTTHIISDQLAEAKKKSLKNALIVKSSWIYDCVKAGKALPTADYLLFKPLGIVDMFNGKSIDRTASSTMNNGTRDVVDGQSEDLVNDDAMNGDIVSPPTDDMIKRLQESPSKHSMTDKNLSAASVTINNVRCTVYNTLHKYIGEASCQLHIRLRELFLKGKSLTLIVGVKKAESEYKRVPESSDRPNQKIKCPLDLTSRSTILPRASNDVALINGYAKGLMSTIKIQISHIKMIKVEMTNLEKCTEEEIAKWTSKAAAQSIPTFTTPLEEDKQEGGMKESPLERHSPDLEVIDSEPPAKRRLSPDGPEPKYSSKSPAKSPARKAKGKTVAAPVLRGPMDMFLKRGKSLKNNSAIVQSTKTSSEVARIPTRPAEDVLDPVGSPSSNLKNLSKAPNAVSLLKMWVITGEPEVDESDLLPITSYFRSLILDKNWSKLKLCMDTLYEDILQRNQVTWKEGFNFISQSVRMRLNSIQPKDESVNSVLSSCSIFDLVSY